jgi:predicted transglutaminase-like cysteine proteinase
MGIYNYLRAATAGLLVLLAFTTASQANANRWMNIAGITSSPIGHVTFCRRHPSECKFRASDSAPPVLTEKLWAQLIEVNNHFNMSIQPVTDQEYYNVAELWTYPKSFGDCEDYVLAKRKKLMKRGWPESALLITVVRDQAGDGHAVLTVRTDRGDVILDNKDGRIQLWNETPYRYLKRQSENASRDWVSIVDRRSLKARILASR